MAGARDGDRAVVEVQLKPLDAGDEPVLFALFAVVRAEELAMASWEPAMRDQLLRIQFAAQWGAYRTEFPQADTRLITRDGSPIGWVIVDRSGSNLHGIDIAVLAAERRHGIGTQVIHALQQEAAAGGRPMVITVKRTNQRARVLYDRLGFSVTRENDVHLFMQWQKQ